MFLIQFLLYLLSITDLCKCLSTNQNLKVFNLVPGEIIYFVPAQKRLGFYESEVRIYCYEGSQKTFSNYFQSINLQIDIENIDDFTQYEGETPEIVKEHYNEQKSLFSFNFFTYKKTKMRLNPFNQTCMGIETLQPYSIRLNLIRVDIGRFIIFCIAVVVFLYAARLSKNALFYYIAGISLGVCASFLILMYLAGKLFPRRSMMIGVLAGGSTLALYVLRLLWDNFNVILVSYKDYLIGYVLITGFISFVLCYRFGPPKNKRSKDLIEWCLQIISLVSVYFSSYYTEASIGIIILLLTLYYFPRERAIKSVYRKWFPPSRRYLTLEEYRLQGIIETKKGLDELRDYCSSPECKQWKVMTRLKNPKRFASFIEGEEHLMDEEIFDHDSTKFDTESDDSGEDELDCYQTKKPEKNNDNKTYESEEISDDEELFIPTKLTYRGPSASRIYSPNGSRNHSYNRSNISYPQENVSSSNNIRYQQSRVSPFSDKFIINQARDSPYSGRIISPTSTINSPFKVKRMTPNNSRSTPNISNMYCRSFREYSDEES